MTQWKPLPGYKGTYEVNDKKQVRSIDRFVIKAEGYPHRQKGKLLKPLYTNDEIIAYRLWKNNEVKTFKIKKPAQ